MCIPEGGGEETCVGDFQMGFSSKPMYSRDPSDRAALLIDMISYCKNRWGSTLYYIDSSVTSDGGALKGEIYKRVQAAHPDVLLMPENQCADAYAYTAPVDSGSAHYVFKTPKNIKLIWRGAFTGILAPFVASYSNQYAMGVSQGDIPFFYEWETASISNFYKGGVKIPPTSKIIGLTNGSTLYVNAPIEIHGEANDPDGTIQKVEFYYSTVAGGLTYLGEDATAPYNFVCSNLPVGRFVLSIKAIDSDGLENWSAQVAIRILPVDASPYFSPIAGTYREPLEVTISSISSNAAIYYTLDGSVPSYTNGTLYQQPVVVTNNTIISAVSYIDGLPVGNVVTGRYNVRCSSPWFEPWPGTYDYFPFVSITSDVGYTVYYTVDGSTPSITNGMLFTNSIFIITNTTLKAVCYNENMEPSVVTRGDYIIRCKTPILLPAGGTYNTEQSVTISSLTYNATIIYTTDGTIPSQTNGLIYTNSVKISSNTVIKAMATRYDLADSLNTSGTYYIRCVQPVFIPPQGTYSDTISVSIATTTENATIKYTIDGTTPNQTNGIIYSAPIAITTNSTTLKAVAYKTGMSNSPVASGNYILKCAPPLFSLPGGTYTVDQITVAITSITPYASIYYTLDGSLPSQSNGFLYVSPIIIRTNTILKALAYRENFSNSVLSSADYYLRCATPLFSHISGIYTNGIELGISCGSTGADIYYTLDGSIPSRSNGVLYSGSVEIRSNVIVKAIGVKDWMMDSDVASCVYTVRCARPMFNPVCGVYTAGQNISISSETAGVEIRYTVDGSIPSSSNGIVYSGGVWLESNVVLRAIAYSEGKMDSEVREMRYYFVGGGGVSNISLWVGGEDNLWGDGSNWLGGIVPGINDYAVFPGWATRKYIDLGGVKRFVRGMIFSDDGGGYSISNGGLVVISNIVQDGVGGVSILSEVGLGGDVGVYGYGSGVVEVYGSVTGASRNIYVDLTNSVLRLYGTNNYQNMYITNGWLGVYGINENTGSSVLTLRGLGRKVIDIGVSNRMPFGGVGGNFRWDLYGGSVVVRSGISNGVELSNYLDVGSGVGDIYSEASNGVSFNFARINGGSAYMRFNVNVSTMRVGYVQSGGDGGGYFVKNGGGCLYVGGGSNVGRCDLFYMKEGRLVIDIDTNSYFAWRFGSGLISNVDSEVVLSRGGEYRITANRWEHNGFSRCVVTSLVEGVVLRDRVVLYGGVGRTGALEIGSSVGWNMVGLTLSGNGYLDVRSRRVSVGGIGQAGNSYLYKLGGGGLELIGGGVSYIGGVIVRGGEFIVNGYCSNIVSVYSGGLVGGTGYIYKCVVYSNGVFGGGDSGIGMIIVSNITFEGGGIYEWEYGGGGGDSVKVLNNLVMGTGMVFRLMHLSGGIDTNDELVLFEYGGNNPVLVNSRIEYVGNWVNTNGVISVDTGRKRVVFSGGEAEPYMVSCVEFNPGGGVYTGMVDVFMSSTTTNAVIVYTVDGSEPSYTNGIIYTNAVLITSNTELKAFAYKDWMTPSPTTSAWYYVEGGNQKTLLSPLFQKKHNNTSHIDGIVVRESFLDNTYKTSLPVLPPSYVSVSKGTFTNRIHINWNAIAGSGIRYEIWRSIYERTNEAIKVSTENINDTNYYDLSVEPFTTYYYWIRTVKDNNEFISPFSVADYGYCGTVGPLILLNGKIGTIVITNDEPLTIAFQIMNVPDELNYLTEWWGLLYSYQNKKYYYFDSSMNWIECYNLSREPQPCYTGRLINIDPIVVLEISVMPAGMYDVWFIIDAVVDGKLLDASCVLYDKATIIVQYNRE